MNATFRFINNRKENKPKALNSLWKVSIFSQYLVIILNFLSFLLQRLWEIVKLEILYLGIFFEKKDRKKSFSLFLLLLLLFFIILFQEDSLKRFLKLNYTEKKKTCAMGIVLKSNLPENTKTGGVKLSISIMSR